jgi:hypothetical protein
MAIAPAYEREESEEKNCDIESLVAFASDSLGQLDITFHDRHSVRVDGAQVGVFEEADEKGL